MKILAVFSLFLISISGFAQTSDTDRLERIKNQLTNLTIENEGLSEQVSTDINVNNISLSSFLLGVSEVHDLNINVSRELENIQIANNFSNVSVADLFLFLCKEYSLSIDFTGNIMSFKIYRAPEIIEKKIIPVSYAPENNQISVEARNDKLHQVFKRITEESAKNLVYTPELENKTISVYIESSNFDQAMQQIAIANDLVFEKDDSGFYTFRDKTSQANQNDQSVFLNRNKKNEAYEIINKYDRTLRVNFQNTPIKDIITALTYDLDLNVFKASPLDKAGNVTFKSESIGLDKLLEKIFESGQQNASQASPVTANPNQGDTQNPSTDSTNKFSFKKADDIYYFGTENQLSLREIEVIRLQHRSVELVSNPAGGSMTSRRSAGRSSFGSNMSMNNFNNFNNPNNYNNQQSNYNQNYNNNTNRQNNNNTARSSNNSSEKGEAITTLIPDDVLKDLDIKVDYERNSLYVNGSSQKIASLKKILDKIDQPVPVVLIEVMILEVNKSAIVETGVSWGLGEEEVNTRGQLYPDTDVEVGANTINKVIGGFDGFGSFNIGKVVPNFFARIKAMEANGNLKVRSTPKLSTLSGHRANFSNGETSYYAVTQQSIIGSNNPVTSEITNYVPIDAELGLTIKPLVSGDGQVTLDIFVVQSNFGQRIEANAPPDINSREFSSLIRVQDQDIVVLGGLEEQTKDDSGTGVPLLARIPIIKWLFSERRREDSKSKLTILIKPTIFD